MVTLSLLIKMITRYSGRCLVHQILMVCILAESESNCWFEGFADNCDTMLFP